MLLIFYFRTSRCSTHLLSSGTLHLATLLLQFTASATVILSFCIMTNHSSLFSTLTQCMFLPQQSIQTQSCHRSSFNITTMQFNHFWAHHGCNTGRTNYFLVPKQWHGNFQLPQTSKQSPIWANLNTWESCTTGLGLCNSTMPLQKLYRK